MESYLLLRYFNQFEQNRPIKVGCHTMSGNHLTSFITYSEAKDEDGRPCKGCLIGEQLANLALTPQCQIADHDIEMDLAEEQHLYLEKEP